ncbi:hypothetical protein GLAREA_03798 [Glarea lozoyensis ATCC 20868]|uniref:Actin-like ATPase n=1 Tax=Glarea lozoyensis (strain ATCC 20868 / MF5171) TaxID=1116229 RepID=S3DFU2_GLAL2|nr:uncharacterized protein GLAREA_03798 [Glarea lozoyensis ATCC 20868]EPE30831.1 hypothetical protein GLAREA_03798 [Glarea lozoyensis ATCC 20868]
MSPRNYFKSIITVVGLASLTKIASAFTTKNPQQQPLRSYMESYFSVGFSLQSSYGAAAIIFESADGSLETHTRVYEPGILYQQVMERLSLQSSRHLAPPYNDDGEFYADMPRQTARMLLRTSGLPASVEVGVLAQTIRHLRSQLESDFSISISEAVFTSSHLLALYQDDMEDIAVNVGIKYITPRYQWQPIFWETAAAYAGHGFGMCKHWQDEDRCRDEDLKLPDTTVLSVHYSQNALTVSLAEIQTVFSTWEPNYRRVENFTLGSNAISGYSSLNEYWADVRGTLLQTMEEYPLFTKPQLIIVTGIMTDGYLVDFLKSTMSDYLGKLPKLISTNTEVVAAMGAAEFMRRRLPKYSY